MQRCNSVDDAIFCSNNRRRGINSPGAFTIQNRLFAGGVRSNGAQNFSIEDRMPLDGSGCHVRLSRFLFLFFFSFFFLYPAPWLLSRKRTREPERPATTICERSKRRFRFSLLRSIPRRANDVRNDEYDCLVASARFQYFPIRKFSYEKRSFDSKEPGQAERVSIQISPLSLLSLPFSNIARDTTS